MSYTQSKQYATNLADRLVRIELMKFFENVHAQFYKDIDVNFMEYFLSIAQREGEFVVHHSALREYGVMTSTESGDVITVFTQNVTYKNERFFRVEMRGHIK